MGDIYHFLGEKWSLLGSLSLQVGLCTQYQIQQEILAWSEPPPPSWQCQDFYGCLYSHPSLTTTSKRAEGRNRKRLGLPTVSFPCKSCQSVNLLLFAKFQITYLWDSSLNWCCFNLEAISVPTQKWNPYLNIFLSVLHCWLLLKPTFT